jgi:hypothetical protein
MIKLFAATLVCAVVAFAQTDTTKPSSPATVVKTQIDKKTATTGVQPKAPTNWSKVKDLFM